MIQFIDDNRLEYGIEPICRVLTIVSSTYYCEKDLKDNPDKRSHRCQHDDFYIDEIKCIWTDSKCHYGARKDGRQMKADGIYLARCIVERLVREHGL